MGKARWELATFSGNNMGVLGTYSARRPSSGVLSAIAEALFLPTGSIALEKQIIRFARNPLIHFGTRIDAVIALRNLATPAAIQALEELKTSGNKLVAYQLKEAVFRIKARKRCN